jgi:ABC-type transport system substrate-binding protein
MNKKIVTLTVSVLAAVVLSACNNSNKAKTYTFHEYLTVSPSNWNELTYQDNNDTEIMSFISGSFFTYNFKTDANGNVLDGEFLVEYDGAKGLEDITSAYAGNEKYLVPEGADAGYAYKIILREDLKWDDGTPIKAEDFVYTMKEQENPLFKNYRADSFYNSSTVIHNAENYVKQGSSGYFPSRSVYGGVYDEANDSNMYFHLATPLKENDPFGGAMSYIYEYVCIKNEYEDYAIERGMAWLLNALWSCPSTQEEFDAMEGKTLAEIKADANLKASWDALIGWWQTEPGEELDFFVSNYTYPELSFDDVGIFVGDKDNELIIVLDKPLYLLKDDGTLSYKAAYNMSSLPVVKRDLYEANKVAPQVDGGLWTSRYNSSVETSASWGPYKLTSFQAGKQFVLERNPNWYGYGMDEYKGQYQTDKIVCDIIAEYETAFQLFEKGDIDSIGLDASKAPDYKNSERAIFTASDFVGSLQLQSRADSLIARSHTADKPKVNKILLTYVDFRKAISLAINRADYTNKCTTASLAGFGIFNSMHYYDVENGGVYRNTDFAKQVICDTYGVNVSDYASLDEAYNAVTGYNLDLAKELLTKAYNEAIAAGDMTADDDVVFVVGSSELTIGVQRQFDYLNEAFKELAKGTPLEGRLSLELDTSFGTKWASDFRNGAYDICTGGWTGAAWDPGYFLLAYLSPDYMYSQGWETDKVPLTYNPYGDGNPDHEYTMTLIEWYNCLNGISESAEFPFDWSEGAVENDFRLGIIAQLEKAILGVYYTVPLQYNFSASLLSYKVEYKTTKYNTFMGYGGIRYMTYNYDDAAWDKVKSSKNYKN